MTPTSLNPPPDKTLIALEQGEIKLEGQFMWGSNYTYLCHVEFEGKSLKAVYKPIRGERPLWDFPSETLAGREVAAYLISEAGGWNLVPPTVYRSEGPGGPGALQLYIEHDPEINYFKFTQQQKDMLKPIVLFDAVINNTDRKGGHILIDQDSKFWLIDHGICFHSSPKLRTVVWDFAEQPIPDNSCQQLLDLRVNFEPDKALCQELSPFLTEVEIESMSDRIDALIKNGVFPHPTDARYSYPWPPV